MLSVHFLLQAKILTEIIYVKMKHEQDETDRINNALLF
jgi:hypothetical protein